MKTLDTNFSHPRTSFTATFAPLLAVALGGLASCSSDEKASPTGQAAMALAQSTEGGQYRFLGTIRVSNELGDVVASLQATETSPNTELVSLPPGTYGADVAPGYACSYAGDLEAQFTGCTFTGADPDPFTVTPGATTPVALQFQFHFEQQEDVTVVFRKNGDAEFTLDPADEVATFCGAEPACGPDERCVILEAGAPSCRQVCEGDEDCTEGGACVAVGEEGSPDVLGVCACPPGSFVAEEGGCTACPPDRVSSGLEAAACSPCACGTVPNAGRTACVSCPAGTFSAAGSATCTTCPPGLASSEGACECAACDVGSHVDGGVCVSCPAGTYSTPGGACMECPAGTFSEGGSDTCQTCACGTFSGVGADSCTPCAPGAFASAPGSVSCLACPDGMSSSEGACACE